jgi:hypothetical protein
MGMELCATGPRMAGISPIEDQDPQGQPSAKTSAES